MRAILVRPGADLLAQADRARDDRDWAAAAAGYTTAIAFGCGTVRVQVQLGHALKELGRYDEAEAAYRRFLDAAPFDADIHLQLGHLFNRQGDPATALDWYERALRLAPGDADIGRHAETARRSASRAGLTRKREGAMRLVAAAEWSRARPILAELVEEDGEDDLVGILANVTKEDGDLVAAAGLYARYGRYAAEQAPDLVADVELQSGHLAKIMGDHRAALKHYIRARDRAREHPGRSPDPESCRGEIEACISTIYTCFHVGSS